MQDTNYNVSYNGDDFFTLFYQEFIFSFLGENKEQIHRPPWNSICKSGRTIQTFGRNLPIPLFLFTKVVYCNQDWSEEPCPDITEKLDDIWVLLFWPAFFVVWGLLVGWIAATLSNTPNKKAAMAACAFGNWTGLPITLLSVVHANFPTTTELGSVYLHGETC